MVNANAPAFDGAKSLWWIGTRAHWERGMDIAAAVAPVVAKDHGRELEVHGDIIFLSLCVFARF